MSTLGSGPAGGEPIHIMCPTCGAKYVLPEYKEGQRFGCNVIQAVGNRAVNYHLGLESRAGRARKKVASIVREARRKLPGPRRRP